VTIPSQEVAAAIQANSEKRLVAAGSVGAAIALTAMKVVVGALSGSIGILSEAAHSAIDLAAAGMTLWAVHAAGEPADEEHPYGHGKIENLSALFETGLLLATCVWIAYEAIGRLISGLHHVDLTVWMFLVMGVSIAIDISRSRALRRAAKKHRSQALEADALHFATDVWSSMVVIAGLLAVWAARHLGLVWLEQADAVAALGVAAIAVWVSLRLGKKSIDDLIDAAPAGLLERVAASAHVSGALAVSHVRVRQSGAQLFADIHIDVEKEATFEEAHAIAHRAEESVRAAVAGVDVVVHVNPAEKSRDELAGGR
jgi:cation diffusion facilitator family transporter